MLVYWSLFACFAVGALQENSRPAGSLRTGILFFFFACALTVVIGFRYRVGGDWLPYLDIFDLSRHLSFFEVLVGDDPGYEFINWAANHLGADIWLVNLTCATIFTWGLVRFAVVQPRPWLTVLVAIPYLVIVVAMGYTRQGVSIGIIMAGLASKARGGSLLKFASYVFAAALFHKTAVLVMPLVAITAERTRVLNLIVTIFVSYFFYDTFLAGSVHDYIRNYIGQDYQSQGATIRVGMSVLAAALFFAKRQSFLFDDQQKQLWTVFALTSLVCLFLLVLFPSSTAVDRIALYTIPLQLVVLPRVPSIYLSKNKGTVAVIAYSFAVQFTFLNYASFARAWVPYRFWTSDQSWSQRPGSFGDNGAVR